MTPYLKACAAIEKHQRIARQEWRRKFAMAFCGALGWLWFVYVLLADTRL